MSAMTRSIATYGDQLGKGAVAASVAATAAMKNAAANLQNTATEQSAARDAKASPPEEESSDLMDMSTFMGCDEPVLSREAVEPPAPVVVQATDTAAGGDGGAFLAALDAVLAEEEARKLMEPHLDSLNGLDPQVIEKVVMRQWWGLARDIVVRSHTQQVDLSFSVRKAVKAIKEEADELLRTLDPEYGQAQQADAPTPPAAEPAAAPAAPTEVGQPIGEDEMLDIDSFCQMGEMPVKRAGQIQPGDNLSTGDGASPDANAASPGLAARMKWAWASAAINSLGSAVKSPSMSTGQSLFDYFKGSDDRLASVPADKYVSNVTLRKAIEAGHTVLVKGSWLTRQCVGAAGGVLPRRQDLEMEFPDAIWKADELIEKVERGRVGIIVVSYCWLSWEHPDPNGEQMRTICHALRKLFDGTSLEDTAMFIDWLSMFQKPRSEVEQALFEQSLSDVHVWFAHSSTRKWMLTKVPDEAERSTPYAERGWPTLERSLCEMITKGSSLLDLGKMDDTCSSWDRVLATCKAQRRAPATPEAFSRALKDKYFGPGSESDYDVLSQTYATAFGEVILATDALNYSELEWDDEEAVKLTALIPRCVRLQKVALYGNRIGEKGALALAEAISRRKTAPEEAGVDLWLTNNPIAKSREMKEARERLHDAWDKAGLLQENLHL